MAVRSTRLALGRVVTANSALTVYTVPTNRTLVVRSMIVQNQGANTATFNIVLVNAVTGTQVRIIDDQNLPSRSRVALQEWGVLEEGDQIRLTCNQTNHLNYWLSGALLFGDPS